MQWRNRDLHENGVPFFIVQQRLRLCAAAARTGLQRAEDTGGPGQGHLNATVSREVRLHPGEAVPGEAGHGERWQ